MQNQTHDIRRALDGRLRSLEWRGQGAVWSRVRRAAPRLSLRLAAVLCAAVVLVGATALAARSLLFSPRQTASQQAHALLYKQYGLDEELLALFHEHLSEEGDAWTITFTLPVYGDRAGEYTVTGGAGSSPTASWSHDGAELSDRVAFPALWEDVWGPAQLERMREIYRDHAEAVARVEENGGWASLSLEERSAIDDPLMELPALIGPVNTIPSLIDLSPTEAEAFARGVYALERNLSSEAAAQAEAVVYLLTEDMESNYYDIRLTDADGPFRILFTADSEEPTRILRIEDIRAGETEVVYDPAAGVDARLGPDDYPDLDAMTHAERAAYAAEQLAGGGDPREWNYLLPGAGDISEEEAVALAKQAVRVQLGLTEDALDAMTLETSFLLDYDLGAEPVRAWWVRFVDNIDDYQVTLRAADGTIEDVLLMDGALGCG